MTCQLECLCQVLLRKLTPKLWRGQGSAGETTEVLIGIMFAEDETTLEDMETDEPPEVRKQFIISQSLNYILCQCKLAFSSGKGKILIL